MMRIVTCAECGVPFETQAAYAVVCSVACRRDRHRKKMLARYHRPEVKAAIAVRNQLPDVKARRLAVMREYRQRLSPDVFVDGAGI